MNSERGFTLIELMVVVVIIAIIAAVAFPYFKEEIHKSHRSEAYRTMSELTLFQEKYRSNNATYGTCNQISGTDPASTTACAAYNNLLTYYTVSVSGNSATGYTLRAVPKGGQTGDRCGTYTYTMSNGTLSKSAATGQSNCL